MSATEIIEEIKKLPREEQEKVVSFVDAAKAAGALARPPEGEVSDEFRRIAEEVFATNTELFQRLAR